MIFVFIAAWLAYKKAKETDRNGIVWVLITAAAFIGTQLVGLAIGVLIAVGAEFGLFADEITEQYTTVINTIAVIASVIVSLLIIRHLGKVPENDSFTPPPSPPAFN